MIVMHAIEWPFGDTVTRGAIAEFRKSLESSARQRLTRLSPRSRAEAPGAQSVITTGKASVAILKLARARSVDLIVMGVSGRGTTDVALLGSTTHQVIREGSWPGLTVRTVSRYRSLLWSHSECRTDVDRGCEREVNWTAIRDGQ